jgi:tRNA 2-thiouridine synthesizing protein E
MPDLNVNGRVIAINEDGFLLDPEVWDEEVAGALAKAEEGIAELSDDEP